MRISTAGIRRIYKTDIVEKKDIAVKQHERLWTRDFILVSVSNLLMSFAFYMLIPVFPFYLIDNLGTSSSVAGIILSIYTVSALMIRPFAGYIVDSFKRKPLYLMCYGVFTAIFAGYTVATALSWFIMLRILHGFSFGLNTVSGNTVAVDIIPKSRLGEGIGYFGMTTNMAMAIGPASGLWIYQSLSFNAAFLVSFLVGVIGFISVALLKPIPRIKKETLKRPVSVADRFILLKGLPCIPLLFMIGIGYGVTTNYIGLYCSESSFEGNAGLFFLFISIGMVGARFISTGMLRRGSLISMVLIGTLLMIAGFLTMTVCNNRILLYFLALIIGGGIGYLTPSFQTILLNLGRSDQRGTANATFFLSWDTGIGLGIMSGGAIIQHLGFGWLFDVCAIALVCGLIYFIIHSRPYYHRNKLA